MTRHEGLKRFGLLDVAHEPVLRGRLSGRVSERASEQAEATAGKRRERARLNARGPRRNAACARLANP